MIKSIKKKCQMETILLGMIFVLLTVCTMLIGMNQNGKKELEKLSRGFYSENIEKVIIDGVKESFSVETVLKNQLKDAENLLIFKTGLVPGKDVRGVCYCGEIEKPAVQEGHFFTQEECFSDEPLILIGKNYLGETFLEKDDRYLMIQGTKCRVVGILGTQEDSRYDEMQLLNMSATLTVYGENGTYVLDGNEKDVIQAVTDSFVSRMGEVAESVYYNGEEELGFQSPEETAGETEQEDGLSNLYIAMVASFLLAAVSALLFWFRHKKKRMEVESFLGAGKGYMLIRLSKDFLIVWAVSYALGMGATKLIQYLWIPYNIHLSDCLYAVTVTLMPGMIMLFVYGLTLFIKPTGIPKIFSRFSVMNFVLVLQFACFFWLFCQIITYYVNINTETWVQNAKNGYQYYTLYENWDEEDIGDDPMMVENIKKALQQVKSQPNFTYMAVNKEEDGIVSTEMLKKHFGEENYDDFLYMSQYPGYYSQTSQGKPEVQDIDGVPSIQLSLCRMDENAVQHYIKKVSSGRVFQEKDYKLQIHHKKVPVLLGAAYKKYFKVGDTFKLQLTREVEAEVIGILPENTQYISDSTTEQRGYQITTLDYKIILPYFDVDGEAVSKEDEIFLEENYYNYLQGTLVFEENVNDATILKAQEKINEIYLANHLYTVSTINATEGLKLFMKETRQSVNIIMFLLMIMAGFGVFSMCISLINKLNQNLNRYAIEIMNGQKLTRIIGSYVLEITVIMVIAAIITGYLMIRFILANIQFLMILLVIMLLVIIPCVLVLYIKFKMLNVEELLCRKDR